MQEVVIIADCKGKGYGFAKGIYDYVLKKEERNFPIKMSGLKKTVFSDGEFKIKINENLRRKLCFYVQDSNRNSCEWFTELALSLKNIQDSSALEVNVVMPYMRFARQDRKDESRISVASKNVTDIMSLYATRGLSVDLHTPHIREYLAPGKQFDNLYSFSVLENYLRANHKDMLENLMVVSPDPGGASRAQAFATRIDGDETDIAIGYKRRVEANKVKKIKITPGFEGKNCLIVDDIIDTGNTLVKTANELKEKGAKSVYAYGTHGLFSDGTEKFKIFEKVFVSDTLKAPQMSNLETISLVDLFGEAVYRTIVGESLSELFNNK